METRSPLKDFFDGDKVKLKVKLTCLYHPKSGNGDKVSMEGFFYGDKVKVV